MPYKDPEKQRAAQRRYYLNNKALKNELQNKKRNKMRVYVQELKGSTPCADCGIVYPHYVMDFDHLPGQIKVRGIAKLSGFSSMAELLEEIDKCEIVCANCHRHRTFTRIGE